MKVAMLVPSLKPTGPVRVAIDLAQTMARDAQTHFFYFDEIPGAADLPYSTRINFTEKRDFREFDIIHTHGLRPDAYVWYHAADIKPKKVSTLHNYVKEDLSFQYNRLISAVFSRIWKYMNSKHDALVALSTDMKNYYQKFWGYNNIEVIPNTRVLEHRATDKVIVSQILNFKQDQYLLANISYLTDRKGLDQVIRVLPLLPQIRFLHIGEGKEMENLKNLARKLQVDDRCLFMGPVKDAGLYLPYSDAFVLPSRSEGFPLALLEAVQQMVPVICSGLPVLKEAFSKEQITFFELENIASLERAVKDCIQNGKIKARAAFQRFQQNYAPEVVKEKYLHLYRKLTDHV